MVEPWQMTAVQALERVSQKQLTVESYARSLLARIRTRDEFVKAWVFLDDEQVINNARMLDRTPYEERGPIHGLPVGIKDVILTKDMPTQYNSRIFESQTPITVDAAPVATLRKSGALIFGKLTTTEFATSKQGDWHQNHTRNARSQDRTPGGSSSGSGAAVADFQVPIAIGTQTGGSIVRPASFNGCFGWKPTWNIISREGLAQWCITLDTCGFFARSVADLELMAQVFQLGPAISTPFEMRSAKLAFCRTHNWHKAGEGTRKAMADARALLTAKGATVSDLDIPDEFSRALGWHAIVINVEGKSSFLSQYLTNKELLHDDITGYVEGKKSYTTDDILQAYDGLASLRPIWDRIASQYDAVLTPSVPDEAPIGLGETGDMSFCSMWTALHVPCLNIPGFLGNNGMPVGLTLVGPRLTDRQLLHVGKAIASVWFDNEAQLNSLAS